MSTDEHLSAAYRRDRAQRRARRQLLRDLLVVAALTVPVIVAFNDVSRPDVGGSNARAAAEVGHAAGAAHRRAPRDVRRLADRHGGSADSRWAPVECTSVAALVRDYGLPEWMTTVAWRESRCRPEVRNLSERTREQSYGLFQINVRGVLWREARDRCGARTPGDLLDATFNVACAAELFAAYGYRPWDSGTYFNE
jgi:hypothetical protein